MADPTRRVVSLSLGTSARDKHATVTLHGQPISVERRGTDGDFVRFRRELAQLDGHVAAIGLGGADRTIRLGDRPYTFRQIDRLVRSARTTPVVDGTGLKHTLERDAIAQLTASGQLSPANGPVLLVSALDRFGMAQALVQHGYPVIFGDAMFGLGWNRPIRTLAELERLGRLILPIATQLPFKWVYPTGAKQTERVPKFGPVFAEAAVIAGDWHYIRRYAPDRMEGKTILTQTIRTADLDWLRSTGAETLITTTPAIEGETFASNVLEAVIVALADSAMPLSESEYREWLQRFGWQPQRWSLRGS
ncbi:MAG: hypothetical protein SFX74_11040 [Fimbriimonadaceae bacterium]|nr:hypothetical protein [Fimbriimonadaceae bacterium]